MASVSDRELAALRAYLVDDIGKFVRHHLVLMMTRPRSKGFTTLTGATFRLAAADRFSPTYTVSDVVRFVVQARTDHRRYAGRVDPLAGEHMTIHAVGGMVAGGEGFCRTCSTRLQLLRALVADLELDAEGLDQLLAEGRQLADTWLAES